MKRRAYPGYSVLELIIVVTIIMTLAAATIGGTRTLLRSLRFGNSFNKLVFMVQQARSLASTGKKPEETVGGLTQGVRYYSVQFQSTTDATLVENSAILYTKLTDTGAGYNPIAHPEEKMELFVIPAEQKFALFGKNLETQQECGYIVIRFENGTALSQIKCDDAEAAQVEISLRDTENSERVRTFTIHRASGIPQV